MYSILLAALLAAQARGENTGRQSVDGQTAGVQRRLQSHAFADKAELQTAVDEWVSDATTAEATYGHISTWDVSAVTDMSELFYGKRQFNDDISGWDAPGRVVSIVRLLLDRSTLARASLAASAPPTSPRRCRASRICR